MSFHDGKGLRFAPELAPAQPPLAYPIYASGMESISAYAGGFPPAARFLVRKDNHGFDQVSAVLFWILPYPLTLSDRIGLSPLKGWVDGGENKSVLVL